ncbi:MAG: hypothetical protein C3F11_06470 [Methylocystaceae bacterium]|nr:MAG: hypothetical protein C3F11_06470 [Methylocystaceae bacterium]
MTYISAWRREPKTIVYKDENGSEWVREGGSRSWRNFNPGNISKGSFADSCGAIGGDARFAIFPDEHTGLDAIVSLFGSRSYRDLTLEAAIFRYAPPPENDSAAYARAVAAKVGVDRSTPVRSLSSGQLQSLAQAIKSHEGWTAGREYPDGQRRREIVVGELELRADVGEARFAAEGFRTEAQVADVDRIPTLIALGSKAESIQRIQDIAAKAMKRAGLGYTLHNACAATLSAFLNEAGVDVPVTLGAGKLASRLSARNWARVDVGKQKAGDVGVTFDRTEPPGADHIYLVVEAKGADEMLIADNQAPKVHTRYASGRGKTATQYFLRAVRPAPRREIGALFTAVTAGIEIIDPENQDFFPWDDEDTNGLPEPFSDDGAPV